MLAVPFTAGAQQTKPPMPRIAFIFGNTPRAEIEGPNPTSPYVRAFLQGMRELGWIDGQNISIERMTAEGRPDRYAALMRELTKRRLDLIVISGTGGVVKVRKVNDTIPIVTAGGIAQALSSAGLAKSLARPGGTVTGLTIAAGPDFEDKRFAVAQGGRAHCHAHRISRRRGSLPPHTESTAHAMKVTVFPEEVQSPEELETVFASLRRMRVNAVLVVWGPPFFWGHRQTIIDLMGRDRFPAIYWDRGFSEAGGLMSYGADYRDIDWRAAYYVDKILRNTKPGDIPIEQPTKFEQVINLKTAKALSLTPQSPLLRADQVIQ